MNSIISRGGKSVLTSAAKRRQCGGPLRTAYGLQQQQGGSAAATGTASASAVVGRKMVWRGFCAASGKRMAQSVTMADKEPQEVSSVYTFTRRLQSNNI